MAELKARVSLKGASPEEAQQIAGELSTVGFTVLSSRAGSLTIAGDKALFERVFEAKVSETDRGCRFETQPHFHQTLQEVQATIYFPTRPDLF